MPDYVQVLTTTETRAAAAALARGAVEARLAACAQVVGPVESTYWWEGKVETATEWQVQLKTDAGRYTGLEAHIKAHHDYDTPEIIAVPILAGSAEYLAWISAETAPVGS